MSKEDKELIVKDLCARLPYGVKILHEGWNFEWDDELSTVERVVGIDENFIYTKVIDTHSGEEYREDKHSIDTFDDKPYLRPMSSMTDEELREYNYLYAERENNNEFDDIKQYSDLIDWLNAHYFDYRGLIEKGLAIEVTKENNPYK